MAAGKRHRLRPVVARAIAALCGWLASAFLAIERRGDRLPPGPLLIAANHPNSLLDPLVVFRVAGRTVRPLAKEPLFREPLVGTFLRALGGLPVYRRQDDPDPEKLERNQGTFDAAVAALQTGETVQVFPEGRSHSEPAVVPLRTGAARIALRAEAERDWGLGLRISPVGLTYQRKHVFRSRVVASVGRPIVVAAYRELFERKPQQAVRALTHEIARRLEGLTLYFVREEDRGLVEALERIYALEKGWTDERRRHEESLSRRLPRLRRFARAMVWLRANEPEWHARLARKLRLYRRLVEALGADRRDRPTRGERGGLLRVVGREAGTLLALSLPALVGLVGWFLPYQAPRLMTWILRPPAESIATVKLVTGTVVMPLALAAWTLLAWWLAGPPVAVVAALALPIAGVAALEWQRRAARLVEQALLFRRLERRDERLHKLAALRREVMEELEAVGRRLLEERAAREGKVGAAATG